MIKASDLGRTTPDLVIKVSKLHHNGGLALKYEVYARDSRLGLNFRSYGPRPLLSDPKQWFERLFRGIEETDSIARLGNGNKALQHELENKGYDLFEEIFPEDLQVKLWEIHREVDSLQIISEDPWIPWELCKLQYNPSNGEPEEGPFFCETFAMTRWFPNHDSHFDFSMNRIAVSGRGTRKLPQGEGEVEDLLALGSEVHQVEEIIDEESALSAAMAKGAYDAWHITGHGIRSEENNSVTLRVGRAALTPSWVSGPKRKLGGSHPFFFLNCCHSGKGELSLTRIDGWATRLARIGVGAFIGSQWAVDDRDARRFAQAFYEAFLGGDPLGLAVKRARLAIKAEGKATSLAYVVFGEPLARCLPKALPADIPDLKQLILENDRPATQDLKLLATLAAIGEPVTALLLGTFTSMDETAIQGLLKRNIHLLYVSGEPARYRLDHTALKEHIAAHYPEQYQEAHLRITETLYKHLFENGE